METAPAAAAPRTRSTGRPRLRAAASLIPYGSRVADIGTGHGLLPRLLLATGRATHCIASERTGGRLTSVRPLPSADPRAASLELRAGDGHAVLTPGDRIDVAVLLGMGTRTILRLLDQPRARALAIRRYVLQPQTEWASLRSGLHERGLATVEERLVADRGRTYLLMVAERDADADLLPHPVLTRDELLEVGPDLLASRDPLLAPLWQAEHARRQRIAGRAPAGAPRQSAERALKRAARILTVIEDGRSASGLLV